MKTTLFLASLAMSIFAYSADVKACKEANSVSAACTAAYTSASFQNACRRVGGQIDDICWCTDLSVVPAISLDCQDFRVFGYSRKTILDCKNAAWSRSQFIRCVENS